MSVILPPSLRTILGAHQSGAFTSADVKVPISQAVHTAIIMVMTIAVGTALAAGLTDLFSIADKIEAVVTLITGGSITALHAVGNTHIAGRWYTRVVGPPVVPALISGVTVPVSRNSIPIFRL